MLGHFEFRRKVHDWDSSYLPVVCSLTSLLPLTVRLQKRLRLEIHNLSDVWNIDLLLKVEKTFLGRRPRRGWHACIPIFLTYLIPQYLIPFFSCF